MVEYRPRNVEIAIQTRIAHHAALLIVGPRASGKTTTAARFATTVLRLDDPSVASAIRAAPDAVLAELAEPILIDEWQYVPEVLGAVKRTIDADPRAGRFLITGSARADLDASSWPGTGRLIRVPMHGLTVAEMEGRATGRPLIDLLAEEGVAPLEVADDPALDIRGYIDLILTSGFPEPALRLPVDERATWLESYVEQLLVHDVGDRVGRRDPERLRRFLEAYAANTAGVVEKKTLYRAAGVAKATGEAYEILLNDLLLVEVLPAWWSNRLKRLARSPKRHVGDPALAAATLGVDRSGLLTNGDLLGRRLETFVVAQLRGQLAACTTRPRMYHLRQDGGLREVDLIIEYGGGKVFALEVKAGNAPTRHDARHLRWLSEELGTRFLGGAVLHTGPRAFHLDERIVASPISTLWSAR